MLDIGWSEFLIVAAAALIIIGPKDLPKAMQTVGRWVRAVRRMSGEFQRHVDDMVREAELEDVRESINKAKSMNLAREIQSSVDPDGTLSKDPFRSSDAEGRFTAPAASSSTPPPPPTEPAPGLTVQKSGLSAGPTAVEQRKAELRQTSVVGAYEPKASVGGNVKTEASPARSAERPRPSDDGPSESQ